MTTYLLDTSVAVHALDGQPAAASWMDTVTADPAHRVIASRILRTELTRVLLRDERPIQLRNEILSYVDLVPVTEQVLATAEDAIPRHLKTLDSIHLATAIAMGADVVVVTHDEGLREVAQRMGWSTFDPMSE